MSTPSDRNLRIIEEFRANEGRVGGHFAGKTLLLLHTTGARSGMARVNPLAYVRDLDRYVIVASKGGAPTNPDWYYNILAHPRVRLELGTEHFEAEASVSAEPERSRLYARMAEMMPGFNEYRQRTSRIIPVIALRRVDSDSSP